MPGSTTFFRTNTDEEVVNKPQQNVMGSRQPPPVAPRTTSISLQTWSSATSGGDNSYGDERHARSASMDSLESSGSSSSGGGSTVNHRSADLGSGEYIPTRTVGKTPKLPSHNPLQFVKVQSPLYKKAEQQIKLTKEVKITREALKEGEEEWQSNLDNWKSRRRKVSEKVIQRAEEMRQIEAEEQLRQEQLLQQQRKIKKFSEMRSASRTYHLDLYIGQGDDSGLGGTPEPEDSIDSQHSLLRSDTSEGMTSEAESVDSDIHKSDKISERDPPKVPQKPQSWFKKDSLTSVYDNSQTSSSSERFQHLLSSKSLSISDNISSAEPSDVEGHAGDTETTSSEEDVTFAGQAGNVDSGLESLCDGNRRGDLADSASDLSQDSCSGLEKGGNKLDNNLLTSDGIEEIEKRTHNEVFNQNSNGHSYSYKICIKTGDNKGFGFALKGGKDQGCPAYVDHVTKGGPADITGLKNGDKITSLNGEPTDGYSHASLIFSVKQAVYTGALDITINRSTNNSNCSDIIAKPTKKGSSFAEKLALFSTGVNTPSSNNDDSKSSVSSVKSDETKRESLVLRRRSAFENGKSENCGVTNRRSSCVSQGSPHIASDTFEKRRFVDLTSTKSITQENTNKKGRPPPVPIKPKLKSRTLSSELFKPELSKINGTNEEILPSNPIIIPQIPENHSSTGLDYIYDSNKSSYETEDQELNLENKDQFDNRNLLNKDQFDSRNLVNLDQLDDKHKASFEDNLLTNENQDVQDIFSDISNTENMSYNSKEKYLANPSYIISDSSALSGAQSSENSEIFDNFSLSKNNSCNIDAPQEGVENMSLLDDIENDALFYDNQEEILAVQTFNALISEPSTFDFTDEKSPDDEDTLSFQSTAVPIENIHTSSECAINLQDEMVNSDIMKYNAEVADLDSDLLLHSSACNTTCDALFIDNDMVTVDKTDVIECMSVPSVDNSDKTEDKIGVQINSSPLCLPLEKIDEDDVISASTTTSSDTPDTETVIETLPSNLSPLPNDESNGEDSSKPMSCQETDTEQTTEISTIYEMSSNMIETETELIENDLEQQQLDNQEYIEVFEDEAQNEEPNPIPNTTDDVTHNEYMYSEQQDDEYSRELDESLDQITSLDVIDEIEQRLMHQLEQQDDVYEEIAENLNAQLGQDIDRQWLYFTEEAELLDDLTPRNLEPPREPPPPPPPPESESSEKKALSLARTNSTKRIKKELWRRRSDFLGLDSPEGIDVDNIPPRPPGLEEILKQEREQTQWLEKRLSSAEPENVPLYSDDSTCLDTADFNQSDYTTDYFLDDGVDVSLIPPTDTPNDQWKDNLEEQNIFEIAYESDVHSTSSATEESADKVAESPQHKAKQNIQSLGAAPKAKIMDSNKWITEKVVPVNRKSIEPVFRQSSYNQNYWLAQDGERRRSLQYIEGHTDRRYSMPPTYSNPHPDVTVRTWGDREYEYQQQRPRSAVWNGTSNGGELYAPYLHTEKQDVLRTRSLDSHREVNCDTNTLESEVHKCSCCGKGLCEGSAMGIEALRLYFHIECFRCCLCHMQLGNGSCGTDVQVKNNQLYCPSCFTVD